MILQKGYSNKFNIKNLTVKIINKYVFLIRFYMKCD